MRKFVVLQISSRKIKVNRVGSTEAAVVISAYSYISEGAVVGKPDKIKGQALVAFTVLVYDAEFELGMCCATR